MYGGTASSSAAARSGSRFSSATRAPLPHGLQQLVEREASERVEPPDLALTLEEVRALAAESGIAVAT
ncbi:MAG TPA: hypothetical protein VHS78_04235, partial [Candidatus Elarobacter sp.]|nr:hypothetical protein [Candidatus Elarobacter sp.]